jgi:hypothetical protein
VRRLAAQRFKTGHGQACGGSRWWDAKPGPHRGRRTATICWAGDGCIGACAGGFRAEVSAAPAEQHHAVLASCLCGFGDNPHQTGAYDERIRRKRMCSFTGKLLRNPYCVVLQHKSMRSKLPMFGVPCNRLLCIIFRHAVIVARCT